MLLGYEGVVVIMVTIHGEKLFIYARSADEPVQISRSSFTSIKPSYVLD